ncbi:MAG: glycosyltransferase family 2 protein [Candidatus Omnitrophica bacterium]|nr:glycosyltransferase family 2 protein [Candidatus Omnitrophota bacterium]
MTPLQPETITAVVMTKNSEKWVEGALKSVAGWADEIVVIDGFSSDRTVDICRSYTDKVYQNRWDGYRFCTERNLGNSKATKDWCFHIDPDERATPAFKAAVSRILREGTSHSAFQFKKANFFLGHRMRHGGWHHDSLHLFRRGKARYEGVIHESLVVDGTIGRIRAAVEHYPFESLGQFIGRHNGYSSREAMALREKAGRLHDRVVEHNLKRKPLKRFFKFYVKKRGFLDGMHGLVFSVLFAWVHFINWAKYWELMSSERGVQSSETVLSPNSQHRTPN